MPLLSRLVLAPDMTSSSATSASDGRLTAREILGLDLRSELVVLSSCRATTSFSKRPEDWTDADRLGLSGVFISTGARQVISSLLPISDDGARHLMADFYRRWPRQPVSEALAQAQRARYAEGDIAALGFGVHGSFH